MNAGYESGFGLGDEMARCRTSVRVTLAAIGTVALAAALASCAGFEIAGAFGGLQPLIAEATPGDPARVFIIHGITTQPDGYADTLAHSLGDRLGLQFVAQGDQTFPVPGAVGSGSVPPTINLRTYHFSDGERERLRISALNWSPLTAGIKSDQFHDDNQIPRAYINGQIKTKVINDGLSDAVLFLGGYQRVMRRGVMIGLCAFLDGDLKGDICAPGAKSDAPIAFISESLGSYMLLDAIRHFNATQKQRETSAAGFEMISRLRVVYMFANQIPLLELSELESAAPGAPVSRRAISARTRLSAFLDLVRGAHARARIAARPAAPLPPLQFVAFTDPNDLLSYRVRDSDFPGGDQAFAPPANVLSPNATAWFDLFADPLTAHNGYQDNARVVDLVVCGSDGCAR